MSRERTGMRVHASDAARPEARDKKESFEWKVSPLPIPQLGMLSKDTNSPTKPEETAGN